MAIAALERLNPRERRLVTVLGSFMGVALALAVPIGLESAVRSREADNAELYAALTEVQDARSLVRERQEKKEAILARYGKRAPALAGFLEQAAQHEKLELVDSDNRPDIPHGKRYVERTTTAHLKKAGLIAIAQFLEAIEKSGYPVEVSHLSLRKRLGEADSYDIQVGVSAYDREGAPAAPLPSPASSASSALPSFPVIPSRVPAAPSAAAAPRPSPSTAPSHAHVRGP